MRSRIFEIIAERKVAEHFKKGMVTHGIADVVEVIVLAAGANGFLGSCRPRVIAGFVAGQNVFKLHHSRVGEHQRRIVVGNQRGGRNNLVAVFGKIV